MNGSDHPKEPMPRSEGSDGAHEAGPPRARIRRTPWRGWLLSVPLAAIILVAYLVIRTWLLTGPTITITFPEAAGVSSTGTPLQYKGVQVGSVTDVSLTRDKHAAKVTVSVHRNVADLLRSGTRFWIVRPDILSGDLADLISGTYITMHPGKGRKTLRFKGLLHAPATGPGRTVTLHASTAAGLHNGSPVLYEGLKAGRVVALEYDKERDDVRVALFIEAPFDQHLEDGVRFWRASGLDLSTGSSGVNFNMPSLTQLLSGAVVFGVVKSGLQAGASNLDSHLYGSASAARGALRGRHMAFSAQFPGSAAGIAPGSPVVLKGIRVGTVRSVSLAYDPKREAMVTPVTFDLYPVLFGVGRGRTPGAPPEPFEHVLATLVSHGLRAQVETANLVIGTRQISLVMAGKSGQASLDTASSPPRIPAVEGGGIASLINQINALPLKTISDQVLELTSRVRKLADSPDVTQSLHHLNMALANLQRLAGEADGQIKPTLESLRRVANAVDATANTINQAMGGSLENEESVQHLVVELTKAARAVRILANYLQRHPEALISGRSQ